MLFVKEGTFHALKLCQFNATRGRSCCLFCLLCNSFLKMWFCSYFFLSSFVTRALCRAGSNPGERTLSVFSSTLGIVGPFYFEAEARKLYVLHNKNKNSLTFLRIVFALKLCTFVGSSGAFRCGTWWKTAA